MEQPWEAITTAIKELNARTGTLKESQNVVDEQITSITTYAQDYATLQTSPQRDERILANLAYLQALSAQQWVVASNSITLAVRSQDPSTTQKYALGAILAGLASIASFGLGGIFGVTIGLLIGDRLTSIFKEGSTSPEYKNEEVKKLKAEIDSKIEKQKNERYLRQGLGKGGSIATNLYGAKASLDSVTDPFEFFINSEVELRRTAMILRNRRAEKTPPPKDVDLNVNLIDSIKTEVRVGSATMSIQDLQKDSFWSFMFDEKLLQADLDARWAVAGDLIAAQMRRLAWRLFCRSKWSGETYAVEVDASYREPEAPQGWIDTNNTGAEWRPSSWKAEEPTSWPHKAWAPTSYKNIWRWPALLPIIANDFRGPEHMPAHSLNTTYGGNPDRAQLLLDRKAWVSMAIVNCCKVEVDGKVDFDGKVRARGSDVEIPNAPALRPVQKLLFLPNDANDKDKTQAKKDLKYFRAKGIDSIRIVEVRLSDKSPYFSPTGKKGMLTSPNKRNDQLMMEVPAGGVVEVRLEASFDWDAGKKKLIKAQVLLAKCLESDSTKIELVNVEPNGVDPAIPALVEADPEPIVENVSADSPPQQVAEGSTRFTTGTSQKVTLSLKNAPDGVYVLRLKEDATVLNADSPVYLVQDEWCFAVLAALPASSQEASVRKIRWGMAWTYDRCLQILRQYDAKTLAELRKDPKFPVDRNTVLGMSDDEFVKFTKATIDLAAKLVPTTSTMKGRANTFAGGFRTAVGGAGMLALNIFYNKLSTTKSPVAKDVVEAYDAFANASQIPAEADYKAAVAKPSERVEKVESDLVQARSDLGTAEAEALAAANKANQKPTTTAEKALSDAQAKRTVQAQKVSDLEKKAADTNAAWLRYQRSQ